MCENETMKNCQTSLDFIWEIKILQQTNEPKLLRKFRKLFLSFSNSLVYTAIYIHRYFHFCNVTHFYRLSLFPSTHSHSLPANEKKNSISPTPHIAWSFNDWQNCILTSCVCKWLLELRVITWFWPKEQLMGPSKSPISGRLSPTLGGLQPTLGAATSNQVVKMNTGCFGPQWSPMVYTQEQ